MLGYMTSACYFIFCYINSYFFLSIDVSEGFPSEYGRPMQPDYITIVMKEWRVSSSWFFCWIISEVMFVVCSIETNIWSHAPSHHSHRIMNINICKAVSYLMMYWCIFAAGSVWVHVSPWEPRHDGEAAGLAINWVHWLIIFPRACWGYVIGLGVCIFV